VNATKDLKQAAQKKRRGRLITVTISALFLIDMPSTRGIETIMADERIPTQ
jgi:hypothetical protein